MLYMVVENFRNGDPVPVYRRFRERGRLAPEGVTYVSSWVDEKLERCFQLMETDDARLLPGDVVATGTPEGVGAFKRGDWVEIEVSGIGVLKNPCA